jgi:hypothetical protein
VRTTTAPNAFFFLSLEPNSGSASFVSQRPFVGMPSLGLATSWLPATLVPSNLHKLITLSF